MSKAQHINYLSENVAVLLTFRQDMAEKGNKEMYYYYDAMYQANVKELTDLRG